jgi:putative ABC transport system permease protein
VQQIYFFFKFFIWFSLRNIRKHPGRALTVLFGIALGAAVFTSVRLSIHASLDSFTKSMDLIAGRADRVLSQPGGRVPEQLLPRVLRHPAVKGASAMLSTYILIRSWIGPCVPGKLMSMPGSRQTSGWI